MYQGKNLGLSANDALADIFGNKTMVCVQKTVRLVPKPRVRFILLRDGIATIFI